MLLERVRDESASSVRFLAPNPAASRPRRQPSLGRNACLSRLDALQARARAALRGDGATAADAIDGYFAEAKALVAELEQRLAQAYALGQKADLLSADMSGHADERLLSAGERRVFAEVVKGKPTKIIAFELSLSEATIKAHVSKILRKFNVHSRSHAIALFLARRAAVAA